MRKFIYWNANTISCMYHSMRRYDNLYCSSVNICHGVVHLSLIGNAKREAVWHVCMLTRRSKKYDYISGRDGRFVVGILARRAALGPLSLLSTT
jgi:hypothetical protein